MNKLTRTWTERKSINSVDEKVPVRQVYVWILTTDERVILVSKDGDKWQLPGGKPEKNESLIETAKREVDEETGIDISPYEDGLEFFGYYTVNEPEADPVTYLQVRYLLSLTVSSDTLNLNAERENTHQASEDVIRFVGAVSINEVAAHIPWMPTVEEYRYLVNLRLINK
jgi:8-oxo-dGTP pyrophosphatase MutT (NUDIX family)